MKRQGVGSNGRGAVDPPRVLQTTAKAKIVATQRYTDVHRWSCYVGG